MRRLSALEAGLLSALGRLAAPGGRRGALIVLIYHRVLPEPDPLLPGEPDAARFAAEIDLLARLFTLLPFAEAAGRLADGTLPPRAAVITFDDGYANNVEIAAPMLAARGLPATFFVASGFIDGGRMWNDTIIEAVRGARTELDLSAFGLGKLGLGGDADRRRAIDSLLPRLKYLDADERRRKAEAIAVRAGIATEAAPMMTAPQLRRLAALGMEIGAHSVSHPILNRLGSVQAEHEIRESKRQLERIIGAPVRSFAFPNGRPGVDYGPEHVRMVQAAGYVAAASTAWGSATAGADPYQLPRVAAWDRGPAKYALRLLRSYYQRRALTV